MDGPMETIDGVETGNTVAPNRPTAVAQQCGNTGPTELDERALNEALEVARHNTGDNGKEVAIRAYLSALPASEAGWRDIESAPKDGTWIIAYRPNKGGGYLDRIVIVRWDDEVSAWVWPDQPFDVYEDDYAERLAAHGLGDHIDPFEDNSFTHWMPLPSAPDRRAA